MSTFNVNTMTKEELMKLPAIGAKRATSIVQFRQMHGKLTKDDFITIMAGHLNPDMLKYIDFSTPVSTPSTISSSGGGGSVAVTFTTSTTPVAVVCKPIHVGSSATTTITVSSTTTPTVTKGSRLAAGFTLRTPVTKAVSKVMTTSTTTSSVKTKVITVPVTKITTAVTVAASSTYTTVSATGATPIMSAPTSLTIPEMEAPQGTPHIEDVLTQLLTLSQGMTKTDLIDLISALPEANASDTDEDSIAIDTPCTYSTGYMHYQMDPCNTGILGSSRTRFTSTVDDVKPKYFSNSASRSYNTKLDTRYGNPKCISPKKEYTSATYVYGDTQQQSRSTKGSSRHLDRYECQKKSSRRDHRSYHTRSEMSSESSDNSRSRSIGRRDVQSRYSSDGRKNRDKIGYNNRSSSRNRLSRDDKYSRRSRSSSRHQRSKSRSPSFSRSRSYRYRNKSSSSSSSSRSRSRGYGHSGSRRHKYGSHDKYCKPSRRHDRSRSSSYSDRSKLEKRGNPKELPSILRYDGKTSWLSFKEQFESYRAVSNWTDSESKDYLTWSLQGKALDFFTITNKAGHCYSYKQMMKKLETRFGDQELTETSRVKFQQARQSSDESLDDWADRVLTLSTYAFKDLPEEYRMREAISKFCQGCIDREAGKHACFEHPRSIQAALNAVKHHQYISEAVDGKKHSRRSKDDVSINAVNTSAEARVEQLLNKAMEQLSSKIQQLTTTNKEIEFANKGATLRKNVQDLKNG
ncbi:uncharacterized protein LOC132744275 [Ruditapes philippinarum]|uniref:uncharacterized protein LOC132744275 n=1 Tax=Ruditapes philippinarum TaxID=129788 RepID=UPI00295BC182|nr:uncharacterized protein LOC132744275 [Ruditapes philippinarum]